MVNTLVFLAALALLYGGLLWWGVRRLPAERWQIAASIPVGQPQGGHWRGVNLTFYGLFTANAVLIAALVTLTMLGSLGLSPFESLVLVMPLLSLSAPGARLVARWVEKKSATLTVAGASFIALLLAPWAILLGRACLGWDTHPQVQVVPVMAALVVGWTLGEGLGRLACLSFGCCYGKRLDRCPAWSRRLLGRWPLVFTGPTKKIAYEAGLEGQAVLPVQALTSLVYGAAGLAALYLFLQGHFRLSLSLGIILAGGWRVFSETLRADYRGGGRLSAYQWMFLAAMPYCLLMILLFPAAAAPSPALAAGLQVLWSPAVVLVLQGLWLATLLYTGTSRVTAATIEFHVVRERI